ncbi:MAG: pyruvate formate lyase family protein, partial [Lawsonella sp.]
MTMTVVTPTVENKAAWRGFRTGLWSDQINVRDFIQCNYTPYDGDASFLAGVTDRTTGIWQKLLEMFPEERAKGVYDVDFETPSTITSHAPGYIDRDNELIVGLQTDAPLKRAIMPNGGWRMVEKSLKTYGYPVSEQLKEVFTKHRKTHNDGVFDVYPPSVRAARHSHIITGLPDAYGRGRIIGDY